MRAAEAGAYAPPALARRRGVVLDLPGGGRGVARVVARLRRLGDRRGARAAVKPVGVRPDAAGEPTVRARAPACAVRAFFPDARRPPGWPARRARRRASASTPASSRRRWASELDPLALSCEKASGALRVVATLRDALGLVVVYVPALVDDDADDADDGADGDDGPGEE